MRSVTHALAACSLVFSCLLANPAAADFLANSRSRHLGRRQRRHGHHRYGQQSLLSQAEAPPDVPESEVAQEQPSDSEVEESTQELPQDEDQATAAHPGVSVSTAALGEKSMVEAAGPQGVDATVAAAELLLDDHPPPLPAATTAAPNGQQSPSSAAEARAVDEQKPKQSAMNGATPDDQSLPPPPITAGAPASGVSTTQPIGDLPMPSQMGEDGIGGTPGTNVYAQAHPLTSHALKTKMADRITEMKDQQELAEQDRKRLANARDDVIDHLEGGPAIRHEMGLEVAALHLQEKNLKQFGAERARTQSEHDRLVRKLKTIMDPRIDALTDRVKAQSKLEAASMKDAKAWLLQRTKYQKVASEKVRDRDSALSKLQAASQAEKEARLAEEQAKKDYEASRKDASKKVSEFHYIDTKYKTFASIEGQRKHDLQEEKRGLEKMRKIYRMEQKRIDESLVTEREQLHIRVRQAESAHSKAQRSLDRLKMKYKKWKAEQLEKSREVVRMKDLYDESQMDYASDRKDVLDAAAQKAGTHLERSSGWVNNDWAWDGVKDPDSDAADLQHQDRP